MLERLTPHRVASGADAAPTQEPEELLFPVGDGELLEARQRNQLMVRARPFAAQHAARSVRHDRLGVTICRSTHTLGMAATPKGRLGLGVAYRAVGLRGQGSTPAAPAAPVIYVKGPAAVTAAAAGSDGRQSRQSSEGVR